MTAERVGNDGLTDAERKEFADRYRATACAPLTPEMLAAMNAHLAAKREAKP